MLTAAFTGMLVSGAASKPQKADFEEITVRRINIVEADGTPKLIISNKARMPGLIRHRVEKPHTGGRSAAGMLFYNDEGTETGGLIFAGKRRLDGQPDGGGSLTFDQYDQDQVVQITQQENGPRRYAGLAVFDRPDVRFDPDVALKHVPAGPQRQALIEKAEQEGKFGGQRMFVGKFHGTSMVMLNDAKNRPRLTLRVPAEGEPTINFLDEQGKTVRTIGARD